jgi:hypothetical protein
MKTIDDLRPEQRPLDPAWSERTLRSILAEPQVRTSRRPVRLAVGLVAAAAAVTAVGLVGPFGTPGTPPAVALSVEHLSIHPEVGDDEFLHIEKVQRSWGYGGAGVQEPWTLEYWVPGDGRSSWIERSGDPGQLETNSFADWGPRLYVDHSSDPAVLLEELRDYAASQDEATDLHGLWTVAFWIFTDPVAPQSFKDEVARAVATVGGVRVADADFAAGGLAGRALSMGTRYDAWFVVDPQTGAFRGMVGHPEKDETWVGPEAPMWTLTFQTSVTDEAPAPGRLAG